MPFEELSWENFERLCHRLTALDGDVEYCARYGRQGDAQAGIDIFARQSDGRYHCLQAKRHRIFSASKLRDAVNLFLDGIWAERAARFTLVVQAALCSTKVQEEVERQAKRLTSRGITFVALGGESITDRLRDKPKLVDDFFGRIWVEALLGKDVAKSLGSRLDGAAFARVRRQLARVYDAQFQSVDPGSFGSPVEEDGRPALTLLDRYTKPDILVREAVRASERAESSRADHRSSHLLDTLQLGSAADNSPSEPIANSRARRLSVVEWLREGQRLVVLGDAGCGKSTLLRVVALDLLHGNMHFPELAVRWGEQLPVYVPFARWSAQVAHDHNAIGLKEIVRRSLGQFLTGSTVELLELLDRAIDEQRILLLVDGLDEWSNEQAARTTLSTLVTTVEAHSFPVVVSGRLRGLSHIGALPSSWKRGNVAPLSAQQQAAIAARWFERFTVNSTADVGLSAASLRTDRFMAELARDSNLSMLAGVPLLLIGLVTLALRGQILPRTRVDIYDQLVRVLLDVHPNSRATASGDTEPRFRHATDPDQRRAALAKLAFVVRDQTGGSGLSLSVARLTLRHYLASSVGFDLVDAAASAAAGEILSVNAETQGLLVEKAPGEVGFVHASFEEFLSAEHISGWSFADIQDFVRSHAGESRWRNVITNLLGRIPRRNEIEQLVAIIESGDGDGDELTYFHRQVLLGEIAFGAAMRAPATARRLALATMAVVETDDWLPARREALASVLKGVSDPALKADIEQQLNRWLPARHSYSRSSLIAAFSSWQPSAQLQNLLFQAMFDEDRGVQRAAAGAYAKVFSSSIGARQRVLDGLARTRDLAAAAALLETLALAWPNSPEAESLFEEAWLSHGAELCLVGILGLAKLGLANEDARDAVLRGQSYWSDVSYPHSDLAAMMLMKYWPADETLIHSALGRTSRNKSLWEFDFATAYLLESPVEHAGVRAWILKELKSGFPFNTLHANLVWSHVGRFAAADIEIRNAANDYWCHPGNWLINLYKIPSYVEQVADPLVATALIGVLVAKDNGFNRHWALRALLKGWGRSHPMVKSAIDLLVDAADEDLHDFVALLPEIMIDKRAARERLIRMSANAQVRRDLLVTGLESCGCDATDDEAVAAILVFPDKLRGLFDPSHSLFRAFGGNARIRVLALERVCEVDAPFAAIASAYADDPEFSFLLFNVAVPLPVDLRTQVVEVAATGAAGTMLETVISRAMLETDSELRVRMVVAHYRGLPSDSYIAARDELLAQAVAVGGDHYSERAAALAGLATIGALDSLATLEDQGKPVVLMTSSRLGEGIAAVERLVCERFAEFQHAFGENLPNRFNCIGSDNHLAEILSIAPSASPAAQAAFLTLAERGDIPITLLSLRSLAIERPGSELLLASCWRTLDSRDYGNDRAITNGGVALILRAHFRRDESVRQRLVEQFLKAPNAATALPLAIFAPDAKELHLSVNLDELGQEFGDWTVAVHLAAWRHDSATFCKLLESMVTRRSRSQFDAQQITNLAVEERLQRDVELEGLLSELIREGVHPNVSGSCARYLAAAGKLSPPARTKALELIRTLGANQRVPVAGYDVIADKWRAVRATLLDAVYVGLELS